MNPIASKDIITDGDYNKIKNLFKQQKGCALSHPTSVVLGDFAFWDPWPLASVLFEEYRFAVSYR